MKKYMVKIIIEPDYYSIEANDMDEANIKGQEICDQIYDKLEHNYTVSFEIEE